MHFNGNMLPDRLVTKFMHAEQLNFLGIQWYELRVSHLSFMLST